MFVNSFCPDASAGHGLLVSVCRCGDSNCMRITAVQQSLTKNYSCLIIACSVWFMGHGGSGNVLWPFPLGTVEPCVLTTPSWFSCCLPGACRCPQMLSVMCRECSTTMGPKWACRASWSTWHAGVMHCLGFSKLSHASPCWCSLACSQQAPRNVMVEITLRFDRILAVLLLQDFFYWVLC